MEQTVLAREANRVGSEPSKASLARLKGLMAIVAVLVLWRGATGVVEHYAFGINETDSLPNWAFITDNFNRVPKRGELAQFVSPDTRFYGHNARFVKIVAGVGGDRVEAKGRDFYVNGRFVGTAKPRSTDGEAVEIGPVGIIPQGQYFVFTPHKDGLDSRYRMIGWIGHERIVGVARPVL